MFNNFRQLLISHNSSVVPVHNVVIWTSFDSFSSGLDHPKWQKTIKKEWCKLITEIPTCHLGCWFAQDNSLDHTVFQEQPAFTCSLNTNDRIIDWFHFQFPTFHIGYHHSQKSCRPIITQTFIFSKYHSVWVVMDPWYSRCTLARFDEMVLTRLNMVSITQIGTY